MEKNGVAGDYGLGQGMKINIGKNVAERRKRHTSK
jgi:hypothetical protein